MGFLGQLGRLILLPILCQTRRGSTIPALLVCISINNFDGTMTTATKVAVRVETDREAARGEVNVYVRSF